MTVKQINPCINMTACKCDKGRAYRHCCLFSNCKNGSNKRYIFTPNIVAGNVLPAESGFNYTFRVNFRVKQNSGFAIDYGTLLYSSLRKPGKAGAVQMFFRIHCFSTILVHFDNTGSPATLDAVNCRKLTGFAFCKT